jgi:Ca2+-binding RTX toxin-like protein
MADGDGDSVTVVSGGGHDRVEISVDDDSGCQVVVVNGVSRSYPPGTRLVVRTGPGDDVVVVAPGTQIRVTVFGGAGDDLLIGGDHDDVLHGESGDDRIHSGGGADRIWGGDGRDYVDAGPGHDTVHGGRGNDTIYGMDGHDRIAGGAGNDFLEGGSGNDVIDGGRGNDAVSGGRGDDDLRGGDSYDRLYGGPGADTVDGGAAEDMAFIQSEDLVAAVESVVTVELGTVGRFLRIEGSSDFVARVRADLDLLRSSPRGQALLAALRAQAEASRSSLAGVAVLGQLVNQGDTVTIREHFSAGREEDNSFAHPDISRRSGRQMLVEYQPDLDHVHDGPPITVLYHELAHVYDFLHGSAADGVHTGADNADVPNDERAAVGLPIDHDGDPRTPRQLDPRHPYDYTENALREELGVPRAPRY